MRHLPRRWRVLLAYLLTDEAYAVAILRYARPAGRGRTCAIGISWAAASPCGLLAAVHGAGDRLGARIPPEWDIDFAVPLTFIARVHAAGQGARRAGGGPGGGALAVLALAAPPTGWGWCWRSLGPLAGAAVARRGRGSVSTLAGGDAGGGGALTFLFRTR